MKHVIGFVASLTLTALLLSACVVYKSSDRDSFDASGKAQAQAQAQACSRSSVVVNEDGDLTEFSDDTEPHVSCARVGI